MARGPIHSLDALRVRGNGRRPRGLGSRLVEGEYNPESRMDAAVLDDLASGALVDTGRERGGVRRADEVAGAEGRADEHRDVLAFILAALIGGGALGTGANRMLGPGPRPGLGLGGRNPTQAEWNAMKAAKRPGARSVEDVMRSKNIQPGYTSSGGAVDALTPYLAYKAANSRIGRRR
jgi:hypothetical protein